MSQGNERRAADLVRKHFGENVNDTELERTVAASLDLSADLQRRAGTALAIHEAIVEVRGVRRAVLVEAGVGGFAVVVEARDNLELVLEQVLHDHRPAGIKATLVVWRAPWWWRLGSWWWGWDS